MWRLLTKIKGGKFKHSSYPVYLKTPVGEIKMPEPIIVPIIIPTPLNNVILRFKTTFPSPAWDSSPIPLKIDRVHRYAKHVGFRWQSRHARSTRRRDSHPTARHGISYTTESLSVTIFTIFETGIREMADVRRELNKASPPCTRHGACALWGLVEPRATDGGTDKDD